MKKEIIKYLHAQQTHASAVEQRILQERIDRLALLDDVAWIKTKYGAYDPLLQETWECRKQMKLQLPLQQSGNKRNVGIVYNGICVFSDSYDDSVEVCSIAQGIKRHPEIVYSCMQEMIGDETKAGLLSRYGYTDGIFIFIKDNLKKPANPINIYVYSNISERDICTSTYNLCVIGKHANVAIYEEKLPQQFVGSSVELQTTDIFLSDAATCVYSKLSFYLENVLQINSMNIHINRDASMQLNDVLGGGIGINQKVYGYLEGENSSFVIQGVAIPKNEEIFENRVVVGDIAKHTQGKVIYKNVLLDKAKNLFDGMIQVSAGADFTDSYLEDHTLMCSADAITDSIPSLEIKANEVKASHGATVGSLDVEELFYAQTRGLDETESKKLLITGFVTPIIASIPDESIKGRVMTYLIERIHNGS